jgi:hypothetical protein
MVERTSAALYSPGRFLALISVTDWLIPGPPHGWKDQVNWRKKKSNDIIGIRTHNLPTYRTGPHSTTLPCFLKTNVRGIKYFQCSLTRPGSCKSQYTNVCFHFSHRLTLFHTLQKQQKTTKEQQRSNICMLNLQVITSILGEYHVKTGLTIKLLTKLYKTWTTVTIRETQPLVKTKMHGTIRHMTEHWDGSGAPNSRPGRRGFPCSSKVITDPKSPTKSFGGWPQSCTWNNKWNINSLSFAEISMILSGLWGRGSRVIKALCYKPEGHGFETRWGQI